MNHRVERRFVLRVVAVRRIEVVEVVPVRLQNAPGASFDEFLARVPDLVRPHPSPHAVAFDFADRKKKIAPPHFFASDDDVLEAELVGLVLFVVTDMEIFRIRRL